ncbi:MAG: response regulator transcription factor [Marinirhabdus sp.]|nr:response regulator transcription factor [Marinirhabdus sp.]
MSKIYHIGVLDDHALIPEAIRALLKKEDSYHYAIGCNTSKDLFQYLEKNLLLDILLLDIQLNNEDGIKICEQLHQQYPQISVIMLSSNIQGAIVMDALKKGAKGFLPKNIDHHTLIAAFQETLMGNTYLHRDISFIPAESSKGNYNYIPKLTRREKEVLHLILEELTTSQIADKLHISASTVETHRASLFNKTGSRNVVGLIKFTLEKGLLDTSG